MANHVSDPAIEYLFRAIMAIRTPEECRSFLRDLCTESELLEMSRRLQAAKMLKNNYIYADIAEQTGLSTATISRVNRCIKYGNEGYIKVLDRLNRKAHH